MKKKLSLFITVLLVAGMLAGCGSGGSSHAAKAEDARSGGYATDNVYAVAEEYASETEEYAKEVPAENGAGDVATDPARKIIKTVNISAETEEFDSFLANINAKVNSLGGYMERSDISGRSISSSKVQNRTAYLVARIPAKNLDSFVSTVTENSNITNKSESADDVTLNYADTEAHITSLRAEQERLNELLLQADDIDTIIAIEARLTDVRYELEAYESRLRTIDNQVDYSTVYLDVREVERYTVVEEPEETVWQRISNGFTGNLKNAWEVLVDFIVGLIVSLPMLFVTALFLGVPAAVIWLIVRKISKSHRSPEYEEYIRNEKARKKARTRAKMAGVPYNPDYMNQQEYVATPADMQNMAVAPENIQNMGADAAETQNMVIAPENMQNMVSDTAEAQNMAVAPENIQNEGTTDDK